MAEIFNAYSNLFSHWKKKVLNFELQKFHKRQNDRKGWLILDIYSGAYLNKNCKKIYLSHRMQKENFLKVKKFSKMHHSTSILTLQVILSFMNFCVAQSLFVKLHLDDVL